jgi:hypothetical protein
MFQLTNVLLRDVYKFHSGPIIPCPIFSQLDILPNNLDEGLKDIAFRTGGKEYLQPETLTDSHFLWEKDEQSPLTGIDSTTVFGYQIGTTILNG